MRLRLLNASNARVYDFGFDDDREFALIGSDSGLLDAPVPVRRVQLSPGERAEIVIDLHPGNTTTLRSYPPDLGMGFPLERTNGGHDTFDIFELRAADRLRDSPALPPSLAPVARHQPEEAAATRSFELEGFSRINGQDHVHLVHFQILDIAGDPPPPELAGWKDTVFLAPGQTVRIISRFDTQPGPDAPFIYHCHILDHEDAGMMGQYTIVQPTAHQAPTDR